MIKDLIYSNRTKPLIWVKIYPCVVDQQPG